MSTKAEEDLRQQIAKLMAQNIRLREVIESHASRSLIELESRPRDESRPCIAVFEEYATASPPRLKMLKRVGDDASTERFVLDNTRFPLVSGEFGPLEPTPGWRCLASQDAPIRIGFNLVGIDPTRVEECVVQVEERQIRDRDFIPVFITDSTAFEVFRLRGHVFEYIPPSVGSSPKSGRAARRYYRARLNLIRAKWNLHDIVDLSV